MDDFGPVCVFIFFALFISAAIAIGVAMGAAQKKRLNEAFGRLARHCGGALQEAGWFNRPTVTFNHRGTWAKVDVYSTGGKNPTYYTQVHFGWPEPGFRMEVYPEGFFQRMGKFLGMSDVEIGSPQFDREYIITGADRQMLRRRLHPGAQMIINSLRALHGNNAIYISFRNSELLIKKLGMLQDFASLQRLTDLSMELYDAFAEQQDEGIQFVEEPPSPSAEAAVCQVCGESITTDLVYCQSCQTPHHHDCWNYYGKCSTFGCGERRCYRPRAKRKSRRK